MRMELALWFSEQTTSSQPALPASAKRTLLKTRQYY